MRSVTYGLNGYQITSYGNGTSYTVERNGKSFHLQGADAVAFDDVLESDDTGYVSDQLAYMMADIGKIDE